MIDMEDSFITSDGCNLSYKIYEASNPVWLIVTHGLGEHLRRHEYICELFGANFNIFRYDLRGHGNSGGEKGYIDDFQRYLIDLDEVLLYLKEKYKMNRYVLFGHSMGGLITAGYIQNMVSEDFYPEMVFLNAPPVAVPGFLGKIVDLIPVDILKSLKSLPSFPIKGLVDLQYLSHDPRVEESYINDKLNCSKLHLRLILGLMSMSRQVFAKAINPKCKMYCTVGTGDRVVSVSALEKYFNEIEDDIEFYTIPDAYHEIHFEIAKYRNPYFEYLKKTLSRVFEY